MLPEEDKVFACVPINKCCDCKFLEKNKGKADYHFCTKGYELRWDPFKYKGIFMCFENKLLMKGVNNGDSKT